MKQVFPTMPSWWLRIMEYLRVAPGRIYAEQLLDKLEYFFYSEAGPGMHLPESARIDVVDFLNTCTPEGLPGKINRHFLKSDVLTNGVYTVPSQRVTLDAALKAANPDYTYNPWLYISSGHAPKADLTLDQVLADPEAFRHIFQLDTQTQSLSIDLTRISHTGESPVFHGFDLNRIVARYAMLSPIRKITRFDAGSVLFTGYTQIALDDCADVPTLSRGLSCNGATFFGRFEMRGITFTFDAENSRPDNGYEPNKVDFRNARFFGRTAFKDVRFIGEVLDMEMSMEDARIQESIDFFNVEFGHANLNCFQMVIGDFVDRLVLTNSHTPCVGKRTVRLTNVTAEEDVVFDFTDVEMDQGQILICNIPKLPTTKLCLSPVSLRATDSPGRMISCPDNYLLISNCEIYGNLYIGNFDELSFSSSRNYGRIIGASNWGKAIEPFSGYRLKSRGIIGTPINNDLMLAVYNNHQTDCFLSDVRVQSRDDSPRHALNRLNLSKAADFIMLKENFQAMGMYDDEDVASILYMEFKPYVDSTTRSFRMRPRSKPTRAFIPNILYKILYATGKYGISPLRVITSTGILILLCALFFFIFAYHQGTDAFTLGNIYNGFWQSAGTAPSVLDALVASLLYSLECVVPFISQFEPIHPAVTIATAIENAAGSFLIGYFSVAVVSKTLRS